MFSIHSTQHIVFLCIAEFVLHPPPSEMKCLKSSASVQHMEADVCGTQLEGSTEWHIPFSASILKEHTLADLETDSERTRPQCLPWQHSHVILLIPNF